MTQLNIFDHYPHNPGSKRSQASRKAARRVAPSAKAIRAKVLEWLTTHLSGGTAESIAMDLFEGDVNSMAFATFRNSVRSRLSELCAANEAVRSKELTLGATAHTYHKVGAQ